MIRWTAALMAAALWFCVPAHTQAPISAVHTLYVEDQRDRGVILADDGGPAKPGDEKKSRSYDSVETPKRDASRRTEMRRLIEAGKLTSGNDYKDASFIFQHSDAAEEYMLAHVLAVEAILHGDLTARWIAAATLDRYLQAIGQKQVFGTQFSDEKFAFYAQHRNDPDVLEKFKALPATMNDRTSMDPYARSLLPAGVRADFCVPDLATQEQYVADANAGKKVSLPRLTACKR